MRRMKIRATPNFGGMGRNTTQPSNSIPVKNSSSSAESSTTAPVTSEQEHINKDTDIDFKAEFNLGNTCTDVVVEENVLPCSSDKPCLSGLPDKTEATALIKTTVQERDSAESSKPTEGVVVVKEQCDTENVALSMEALNTSMSGKCMIKETPELEIIKEHCDRMDGTFISKETEDITREGVDVKPCTKSVENSLVSVASKRRSKIRAMPSFINKRKMIKKEEDASQDSSHTQSSASVETVVETPQNEVVCLDSYSGEKTDKNLRSPVSLRPDTPTGTASINSFSTTGNHGKEHHSQVTDSPALNINMDTNNQNTGIGVANVDSSSATSACKRRSKIRAMPALFKKKSIKTESIPQASDHASQSLSVVGEFEKKANVPCGKPCKQESEKLERPQSTQQIPDHSPTKHSSNITHDEGTDRKNVTVEFSQEKGTTNKFVSLSKLDGNTSNVAQVAYAGVEIESSEISKRNTSSSVAEEKEGEKSERATLKFKPRVMERDPDISNSDDSSGDKENSMRVSATPRHIKKEKDNKEQKAQSPQKRKQNVPLESSSKKVPVLFRSGRMLKTEIKSERFNDDSSDERTEKQIFRERKQEYRKKVSRGGLEPSKMTMFDLIFWNPANNPMPRRTDTGNSKKRLSISSKGDAESIISEVNEEQRIEELGLDTSDAAPPASNPPNDEDIETNHKSVVPDTVDPETSENKIEEENVNDEDGELPVTEDIFAPRVKIGPNGQIIVDEQSIKIQTTAAKVRDEILSKTEVVEESSDTLHYGKWSKKRTRSSEWTLKETARFYKALSTVGTDFSMMEALITWRSRAELKTKFKKEERINRELVDRALRDSTQFDVSIFDGESDYDPEEDRKASRLAEREEAKQRRLEMKQAEKAKEMKQKSLEKSKIRSRNKKRKKRLQKARKELEMKRMLECSEDEMPLETRTKIKKARIKKHKPERRNSFVIDEVTVTWEYNLPSQTDGEQIIEQTVEENCDVLTEDPLQTENAPCQSVESNFINTVERRDHVIPTPSEDIFVNSVSSSPSKNYLKENPPSEHNKEASIVLPDSYAAEQILSEDLIIEGTAVENSPKPDTGTSSGSDALSVHSKEECVTGDTVTDKWEAQKETLQSDQCPDAPLSEDVSEDDVQRMWHFPVSAIQTGDDGQQVIIVPTSSGQYRVPVPVLPPGTSNIVVMATPVPDYPGEHIYHVYVMSPVDEDEQQQLLCS